LEATAPEAFRRVLETNFFGYVHGARSVLPHFREQGHGVLINNASVYSHIGAPWLTSATTSKAPCPIQVHSGRAGLWGWC
jgi:NAD(P)-dependent dehydrogenase (short-subunit alcohol dehydrogenase family)